MIRVEKVATREIRVWWETGLEYQFLKYLGKLIEHRNHLEKKRRVDK